MGKKIKMELQSYDCGDLPVFIDDWVPENDDDVYVWVNLTIGKLGDEGGSDYQCLIATPKGLIRMSSKVNDFLFASRSILIVKNYCWREIKRMFENIIERCEDDNIIDIQWKLQRYFFWEFEDYVEPEEENCAQ